MRNLNLRVPCIESFLEEFNLSYHVLLVYESNQIYQWQMQVFKTVGTRMYNLKISH